MSIKLNAYKINNIKIKTGALETFIIEIDVKKQTTFINNL